MNIDITAEIIFRTARSGGKGGQNVNKVETMVEGRWNVFSSLLINEKQQKQIVEKLASRLTKDGFLLVRSQTERTQLGNKNSVIKKLNQMVNKALIRKAPRIATHPPEASKRKRLENKRFKSELKQSRQKWKDI